MRISDSMEVILEGEQLTLIRQIRWMVLLGALLASIAWSYIAINHLLGSSIAPQQRTADYDSTADSARVHQMDLSQQYWGRQTMFAVAVAFFFLMAVMMNWVLDGRPKRNPELR